MRFEKGKKYSEEERGVLSTIKKATNSSDMYRYKLFRMFELKIKYTS
jgi:hypothetical protein